MILVLGGTTEGRKAAMVLEEAGTTYFYSTKTGEQDITLHNGQHIDGALDKETMSAFCCEHGIRLIVDAAHPFASQLHQTVALVSEMVRIPAIRYERIFPPRDSTITWIDDYSQIPHHIHTLLATTGVNSIAKLKPLEAEGIKVCYRILNRESSVSLALRQGATREQLCYYEEPKDIPVEAEAILMKESGLSGGFIEKVDAAKKHGMQVIVLKRPQGFMIHGHWLMVNGPYGLRRMVEKLLPEFFPLHSGLTTGTCATAAAMAATLSTLHSSLPKEVPIILPSGETINVAVGYGQRPQVGTSAAISYAYCIKEAGDDPDVTNGLEIRAEVHIRPVRKDDEIITIEGGEGVGVFTLPGFDFPPGSAAINKVPREMIRMNLKELYKQSSLPTLGKGLQVIISVPQGSEIARRTFNPRLGIENGISIIGVTGIVKPFSEEAFIDSIRKCMAVAKASGKDCVVINSGGKSERFVKALYPTLPQQSFVEYGNYIGETLKAANELAIPNVTLGVMLGKAVKLAAGHLDTHSRKTTMDKQFVASLLSEAGCDVNISDITLARELWTLLSPREKTVFAHVVISHCAYYCRPLLPQGQLTILLIDDDGNIYE